MIWGYHYFRKHPYIYTHNCMVDPQVVECIHVSTCPRSHRTYIPSLGRLTRTAKRVSSTACQRWFPDSESFGCRYITKPSTNFNTTKLDHQILIIQIMSLAIPNPMKLDPLCFNVEKSSQTPRKVQHLWNPDPTSHRKVTSSHDRWDGLEIHSQD